MNCEQANRIRMIEYLDSLGFHPASVRGNNHWYYSPFRNERTPSFKIDNAKNLWYDHGEGIGGDLVAFVCRHFRCDVGQALDKIETGRIAVSTSPLPPDIAAENGAGRLTIGTVSDGITNPGLLRYLNQRQIPVSIVEKYLHEVQYKTNGRQYTAIGFKNNAGGYELRSPNFKGSSSPKYVTYFDNSAPSIAVFEGFFDFLSFQSMPELSLSHPKNYLVLNSLSFFNRSLLLMEKHEVIQVCFDNDSKGRECLKILQDRNPGKIADQSQVYCNHKDLNEWHVAMKWQNNVRNRRRF